jgi:hypothetical protein
MQYYSIYGITEDCYRSSGHEPKLSTDYGC